MTDRATRQALAPLLGRIRRLARWGVLRLVRATFATQELQVSAYDGEVHDRVKHAQPYGFCAHPLAGAEVVLIFPGGVSSTPIAISVGGRAFRPTDLAAGEVAVYDDKDQVIILREDRIHVSTPRQVVIDAAEDITVSGEARITIQGTGDVTVRSDARVVVESDDVHLAEPLARVDARGDALIGETDPRTTAEMLPDWERVVGLPDACSRAAGEPTLQERRAAIHQRWTARGGQSRAFFIAVAEALGYAVEIEEYRPFVCGLSRCGERLWAPRAFRTGLSRCGGRLAGDWPVRLIWTVRVLGPRVTRFRSGASSAGERLMTLSRAEDLECQLRRRAPAHTWLVFDYQEA